MFSIFKKDTPSRGSVLFRGALPPRAEEFAFLKSQGFELTPSNDTPGCHWALAAKHKDWGDARIFCFKDPPPLGRTLEFTSGLTKADRAAAVGSRTIVTIETPAKHRSALKDRKLLLRYLRAVLGDDGLLALDHQSLLGWGPGRLDAELMHDADLDIEALYTAHLVTDGEPANSEDEEETQRVTWMHTHGLGELGAFDFDVLRPHPSFTNVAGSDLFRGMAFSILEGRFKPSCEDAILGMPDLNLRLVPAAEFMSKAAAEDRARRDDPDNEHLKNRSVVCERGSRTFFGLGKPTVIPSKRLMREIPEQFAVMFSHEATLLMARRARQTLHLVPQILADLEKLMPMAIAKIGYQVDGGEESEQEHMWFEVHAIKGDAIDASLQVQPFNIARMKMGDRGMHPVERLTDWMIMTPVGSVSPRNFALWHMAKHSPEMAELAQLLAAASGGPPTP